MDVVMKPLTQNSKERHLSVIAEEDCEDSSGRSTAWHASREGNKPGDSVYLTAVHYMHAHKEEPKKSDLTTSNWELWVCPSRFQLRGCRR
jgi:hypothetical protein